MEKPLWMWALFIGIILSLLVFDLKFLHKKCKEISFKESIALSAFYLTIGFLFGLWIWIDQGPEKGAEYLTGFAIEKSLAIDNIFVISMTFTYLAIPRQYHHRVLFWGILGVIVLRAIMIGLGAVVVAKFSWVLYLFAVFLIFTGIKMLWLINVKSDFGSNKLILFINKYFRVSDKLDGEHFFVKLPDKKTNQLAWHMTPLFVALLVIEIMDLIFAVDSIPAIFTITTDPYIVYTSNMFAVLGLRALYFALDALVVKFKYLKYALSVLLIFIGSKIFIADLMDLGKFPPLLALGITASILLAGIGVSVYQSKRS